MKLVLHVGMSKSGSTALQRGLGQLRDRLLARGRLYPTGAGPLDNHAFLVAAVVPPERLPRSVRGHYLDKPAQAARDLEKRLEAVAAEIARHRPEAVLMSAQNLFQRSRPGGLQGLAERLRPLADEIEVVAYLRRPSDFYLASTQQILRADHRVRPQAAVQYRAALEGFAAIADRLHVFKYDRALFPGGDVLRHFMERFCPELAGEELPRLDANVSLSTEALSILAAYRRLHHPDKARRFTEDTELLRAALGGADRALPASGRSRLKPEVARAVDEGSVDLLWLRDVHGIVFDGIDYDRVAPMPPRPRPRRIDDICSLDSTRKAEVALYALRHLADAAAEAQAAAEGRRPGGRRGRPGAKAAPGGKGARRAAKRGRKPRWGRGGLPGRVAAFTRRAWARVTRDRRRPKTAPRPR